MTEKKWKKYLAAGLLIASVGLVTVSQSQTVLASNKDTKTVVAATGGQPKPFTYVDSKGKLTGHNIELLKAVFKKLPQYKLKIVKTEFS